LNGRNLEREIIDLSEFEVKNYIVFLKIFGGDNGMYVVVNFVKIC